MLDGLKAHRPAAPQEVEPEISLAPEDAEFLSHRDGELDDLDPFAENRVDD